ncbi:MAG: Nif3-like dinuclear metal center hexameric protein [Phycisphaerales bacterium]
MIIAYHPPIWRHELGRLTDASALPERIIRETRRRAGMAIYTPHTALDAAQGGVTDWLCEG